MKTFLQSLGVFITTILLWWLVSIINNGPQCPSPFVVIPNLITELGGDLPTHILTSLIRILVSTSIALLLAIPLGILIGFKKEWDTILSPFIFFSYPVPKMALLPILMLLFGLSETSKVLLIFMIIFFPLVMDVISGVKSMDREIFEVMKSFGVRGRTICVRLIFPGLFATILNSMKITTGIALSVLFFAENYGAEYGMGYYIMNSWQKWSYIDLYTGVFTISVVGFILFRILDMAEKRVAKWR